MAHVFSECKKLHKDFWDGFEIIREENSWEDEDLLVDEPAFLEKTLEFATERHMDLEDSFVDGSFLIFFNNFCFQTDIFFSIYFLFFFVQ